MERKKYPINVDDYKLFEAVGQGVSAQVYRALCIPFGEIVAIKVLDFERINSDLEVIHMGVEVNEVANQLLFTIVFDFLKLFYKLSSQLNSNISREAQTMILIDHPNVLRAHCSFVNDHNLWVVMPYMCGGSCLHILKSVYPNGFEEVVIATVLREALKGLEYLHRHGHIHRDIKAGNILVDSRGGIKLGDFGVSACLFDSGDRQRTRHTFVGTPCWMAPEVMDQLHGYDFKADIWSFGITALELAHGHAPFSKYPPMKVLLMTLQNAPPSLDYERDKKFSRAFKNMVGACLVKDPSKRPTVQKLLKQPFFKQARSQDYIVRKILDGLPTLGDRHQALKEKEKDLLAQKKTPYGEEEEISQNAYKRGISCWNFDTEDLKAQASLIPDNEDIKDSIGPQNSLFEIDTLQDKTEIMTPSTSLSPKGDEEIEDAVAQLMSTLSSPDITVCCQRLKSDVSDNELIFARTSEQNVFQTGSHLHQNETGNGFSASSEPDCDENHPVASLHVCHERKISSIPCPSEVSPISRVESVGVKPPSQLQSRGNCNGDLTPLVIDSTKSTVSSLDDFDDKFKPPIVQQKGRFKVTSENVDLEKGPLHSPHFLHKSHSMQVFSLASPSVISSIDFTPSFGCSMLPQLHFILQTNMVQRDNILGMMRQLSTGDSQPFSSFSSRFSEGIPLSGHTIMTEKSLLEAAHEKEKELTQEIAEMQWRLECMQDELHKLKSRNTQV